MKISDYLAKLETKATAINNRAYNAGFKFGRNGGGTESLPRYSDLNGLEAAFCRGFWAGAQERNNAWTKLMESASMPAFDRAIAALKG